MREASFEHESTIIEARKAQNHIFWSENLVYLIKRRTFAPEKWIVVPLDNQMYAHNSHRS